ncbi:proteasome alpha subunit [Kribbella voronezhensis]|uniref:Proteasome subunit alpha n=1 Tax=Kribbella voronezhensis TaxID=2512212 RepID=A0A4R7SXR2_9ACTN|nr:proteasome subunit alpha [Kribbella voronezhensis]TDU84071.1 proteasome alpha subunit [Kribbella voronezhensis]
MSVPFYVSPEQLMRDRADFARKGIAKGRSAIALQYADGILFVAENRSPALHKVAEIYDRMAFAAVGRYNEFENLRIAGVRLADMRGYSYDRRDVTGRALANAYAQTLGAIFSSGGEKPLEVEILVAEIGNSTADDQIYRLTYDGSIADVRGYAVMGGPAEQVADYIGEHYAEGISLAGALRLAVDALGHDGTEVRQLEPDQLEVAVLDRTRSQMRKFKRISEETLARILSESRPESSPTTDTGSHTEPAAESVNGGNYESADAAPDSSTDAADDAPVAPPVEDDTPVAPPEDPDTSNPL